LIVIDNDNLLLGSQTVTRVSRYNEGRKYFCGNYTIFTLSDDGTEKISFSGDAPDPGKGLPPLASPHYQRARRIATMGSRREARIAG
jgi:hypothetical protein